MSTLGRKAMKKTLKRLREDALGATGDYLSLVKKLRAQDKSEEMETLLGKIIDRSHPMIISVLRYIQALEDYGYELDEEWDKLLKTIEQAQEGKKSKPVKKPPYRI